MSKRNVNKPKGNGQTLVAVIILKKGKNGKPQLFSRKPTKKEAAEAAKQPATEILPQPRPRDVYFRFPRTTDQGDDYIRRPRE
jgi:hypothetical protein